MIKIDIEFRTKQKKAFVVQSYIVGTTVLALEYSKDQDVEYINLRDIANIHAVAFVPRE